jgi:uncharacterized protein YcfJ
MRAAVYEDDRESRRDRTCVGTGIVLGAAVGAIAGAMAGAGTNMPVFVLMGASAGGIAGRLVAPTLSVDEWDPAVDRRPNVGATSPDDDELP